MGRAGPGGAGGGGDGGLDLARLAEGDTLYRDVAYLYGPLSPWLNGLLFRLFGTGLTTLVAANLRSWVG